MIIDPLTLLLHVQHPVPNAYTLALSGRKPFIVINTALLELLEPQELQVCSSFVKTGIPVYFSVFCATCCTKPDFTKEGVLQSLAIRRCKREHTTQSACTHVRHAVPHDPQIRKFYASWCPLLCRLSLHMNLAILRYALRCTKARPICLQPVFCIQS